MSVTPQHPRATLLVPLAEQTILSLLSVMLLDGGRVATAGLCVSGAFWVGAIAICARRRREVLPRSDRLYLNFGLLIGWIVGVPLFHALWAWKHAI